LEDLFIRCLDMERDDLTKLCMPCIDPQVASILLIEGASHKLIRYYEIEVLKGEMPICPYDYCRTAGYSGDMHLIHRGIVAVEKANACPVEGWAYIIMGASQNNQLETLRWAFGMIDDITRSGKLCPTPPCIYRSRNYILGRAYCLALAYEAWDVVRYVENSAPEQITDPNTILNYEKYKFREDICGYDYNLRAIRHLENRGGIVNSYGAKMILRFQRFPPERERIRKHWNKKRYNFRSNKRRRKF
jgi:hypothetical protein